MRVPCSKLTSLGRPSRKPSRLTVVEEFVETLAADNADATETTMLSAVRPPRIINCFAGPSLLAGLAVLRHSAEHGAYPATLDQLDPAFPTEHLVDPFPRDQFHHNVGLPLLLPERVDLGDIGMVELSHHLRFPQQAGAALGAQPGG